MKTFDQLAPLPLFLLGDTGIACSDVVGSKIAATRERNAFPVPAISRRDAQTIAEGIILRVNAFSKLIDAVMAYRKAVDVGPNGDPALWADAELKSRAALAMVEASAKSDHANKTLPLPAYLANDDVLLQLLSAAVDCHGGKDDTATPAFIAAARQELDDRGLDVAPRDIKEGDRVVCIDYGTVESIEDDSAEVLWEVSGCVGDVDLDRLHRVPARGGQ